MLLHFQHGAEPTRRTQQRQEPRQRGVGDSFRIAEGAQHPVPCLQTPALSRGQFGIVPVQGTHAPHQRGDQNPAGGIQQVHSRQIVLFRQACQPCLAQGGVTDRPAFLARQPRFRKPELQACRLAHQQDSLANLSHDRVAAQHEEIEVHGDRGGKKEHQQDQEDFDPPFVGPQVVQHGLTPESRISLRTRPGGSARPPGR